MRTIEDGSKPFGYGYDAYECKYCNLIEKGIVDPTKVTRSALQNAASICALILTVEYALSISKNKKNEVDTNDY